ncbi:MAG: hypothetical protein Q7J16_10475 [Candidatus Cloacimonadales bacterium]|nr:hypothetical protein [Candidatus Cloacimonadales bacterium]
MKFIIIILLLSFISCLPAENPWLGRDKVAHFTTSAFLTYWNFGMSRDILQAGRDNSLILSVNFTALLGISKEVSDKYIVKSEWSWHDIAYDAAGICAGLILINNLK